MGVFFEGFVVPGPAEKYASLIPSDLIDGLALRAVTVDKSTGVILREVGRPGLRFDDRMVQIGAELSKTVGPVLLCRYDSREGLRSSTFFSDDGYVINFGAADEEYVRLGDDGFPLLDEEPVRIDEFESGEEYETLKNAIKLGLEYSGIGGWQDVWLLITEGS